MSLASGNRIPFDSARINLLALPIAFLVAVLCQVLVLPGMVLWYFFQIPFHELGHSFIAWFGGRIALPIGAVIPMVGQTIILEGRSGILVGAEIAVLGFLARWMFLDRKYFYAVFFCALLGCVFYLSFVIPRPEWKRLMIYSGVGGELVIPTILIVSFYYPMPDRLRWDFFRFIGLGASAFVFMATAWKWHQISTHQAAIPWGSFLSGGGEASGDMNLLRDEFKWSARMIVAKYVELSKLCSVVIIGHYFYFAYQSLMGAGTGETKSDVDPLKSGPRAM